MIKHYTVAEFRKNLKEAFDIAKRGDRVLVDRLGEIFELKLQAYVREEKPAGPSDPLPKEETDERPIPAQVAELERKRDEELEYVQDPETSRRITSEYQKEIDALWKSYNAE